MPDFGSYLNFFHQAAETGQNASAKAQEFSFGSLLSQISFTSGTIFGVLIVVCVLLFVLSIGRTRALVSLLSIYIAFALQAVFPFFGWLQTMLGKELPTLRVGILLLAFIVSFILLNRSVLRGRLGLGDAAFFSVVLIGLLQLGLFAAMILNLAPAFQAYLPDSVIPFLATQKALFGWLLAPLVLLGFQQSFD
ncbi:MAG TPA: hypothetical protein VG941_02305 [Candidatus Paceibacterota bacterium]|nr:hypothetical protein [Candidatus Paceibacterota bacterium]